MPAVTLSGYALTTSGMCGLWDATHFPMVYDQETWFMEMGSEDEILRHVRGGYFVPVKLNTPGLFFYEIRVGQDERPSEREAARLAASSREYLFRSSGSLCFGDYRHLEVVASERVGVLAVDAGEYVAQIHILDWESEEGAVDEEGNRSAVALPDLLILLTPAPATFTPPNSLQTFS